MSFTYDAVGNLATKTNPRSKVTTYAYDNLSRLSSETDPLSLVRSYSYDAASRLTARTDPKSQQIDYTYNDRNELTRIDYPGTDYVSFSYNDAGARTQMVDGTGTTSYAYDNVYRLTSATFPGSRVVGYGYDDASRRTSITYPGGSNQATYAYDAADRLTSVTDWNSNATAYAYDDANRLTSTTLPSGTGIVSSYSYDTADRLTGISHVKDGSTTIASVSYTLDAVGNRTQRVDQAGTHTYAYDNLYRLTSVTYPGPSTTTYAFDAFGNRTSKTEPGSQTTTYAYNDGERLTSVTPPGQSAVSYTWDNNGDLTARGSDSFAWDYEDRMTSATVGGTTTTFAYRGDALRDSRTTGGSTTTFTWDIASGLPVVLDDGAQYLYGAGLAGMKRSGSWYYYLADGLGSTMAIVDSAGAVQKSYTYDVYGKPTKTGALANEFDFAGQQTDGTGLQYLRARYMDPETGRFISRDPFEAENAVNHSPYIYAVARPATVTDRTGMLPGSPEAQWCAKRPHWWSRCAAGAAAKTIAENVTKLLFGEESDRADAFRHCFWSALCTISVGARSAETLTNLHERFDTSGDRQEQRKDLWNNRKGREVGNSILVGEYVGGALQAAAKCLKALEGGQLVVNPANASEYPGEARILPGVPGNGSW
jgi:RHS repeat-associated protein